MDLKDYSSSFIIVGLFIVCLFTFMTLLTGENTEISGIDTSAINLEGLEGQLNSTREDAQDYIEGFSSENPLTAFGELVFFSIWGITKLIINSVILTFNIIFSGIADVLGIPGLVVGIVAAIVLIGLIFAAWKMIKTGK